MRTLVGVCLLACAAALPQGVRDRDASILRYNQRMRDDGQFQYDFETSNGIIVDVAGENRQIGDGTGVAMRGSYSYTSPEGVDVNVEWQADENGFRVVDPLEVTTAERVDEPQKTPVEPQREVVISSGEESYDKSEESTVITGPILETISTSVVEDTSGERVVEITKVTETRTEQFGDPISFEVITGPAQNEFIEAEVLVEEPFFDIVQDSVEDAPAPGPVFTTPGLPPRAGGPSQAPVEVVIVQAPLEDAPAPAPVQDGFDEDDTAIQAPLFSVIENPEVDTPLSALINSPAPPPANTVFGPPPNADGPSQAPVADAVDTDPLEEFPPINAISSPVGDTVPVADNFVVPIPIADPPAPASIVDVPVPARVEDEPEETSQDAIASALRENSPGTAGRTPENPLLNDSADKSVPSSEFIVLGA